MLPDKGNIFTPQRKRSQPSKTTKNTSSAPKTRSEIVRVFIFGLCVIALLLHTVLKPSDTTIDTETLTDDLLTHVHHQNDTVNTLLEMLEDLDSHDHNLKVVNFIGSSGVGKTFIANIVKKHFHVPKHDITGPLTEDRLNWFLSQIKREGSCDYNSLVIFDDLRLKDVEVLLTFLKSLPNDLLFFVINIFNIQETDSSLNHVIRYENADEISSKFSTSGVYHKVGLFHEFDEQQARAWILKMFKNRRVLEKNLLEAIEKILKVHQVQFKGFKGLDAKMKLEL